MDVDVVAGAASEHQHISSVLGPYWGAASTIANLMVVVGYLLMPFLLLRYLPLTRAVKIAGTCFFVTCALSHLAMALGFQYSRWVVVTDVLQAAAVMWFVLGFWLLLRDAISRAEKRRRGDG